MKKNYKELLKILLVLVVQVASSSFVFGQNRISEKVTTNQGDPIPGVSVLVKEATTGTSTSVDGTYPIEANDNNTILTFIFIGYDTQEVAIANKTIVLEWQNSVLFRLNSFYSKDCN